MSVTGISSSILSAITAPQSSQNKFQQIQSEFKQLGQDLQSGNLSQAQSDFTTLTQNLPSNSPFTSAASTTNSSPLAQAFNQLANDLQSGNLQGAQQDFSTLQQDLQQSVGQSGRHHHHHHFESSQNSASSQQSNPITQAFSALAQTLQAGNLQGAQTAYATLQSDLQQIGGFSTTGSSSSTASATPISPGSLNLTA